MSFAREHKKRVLAQQAAQKSVSTEQPLINPMQIQFDADCLQLKSISSMVRKAEVKATMLPEYQAYIDSVLASNTGAQDDMLITLMVWNFDIANIEQALQIATYAIKHKLVTPEQFNTSLSALISRLLAEHVLKLNDDELNNEVLTAQLSEAQALLLDLDMPDTTKAQLLKAFGAQKVALGELFEGVSFYESAIALDGNIGVKNKITQLKKQIEDLETK